MKKVLVAMSGGVDSAVSAFLLKQKGYHVTGANMRFWEYQKDTPPHKTQEKNSISPSKKRITSCCSPEDILDAEKTAKKLGIPFYTLKMEKEFHGKVISYFISDYQKGRTPNPCVHCNTFIKFGEFYSKAEMLGFDQIATGHYASIKKLPNGRYTIYPAKDHLKDQSYYLYGMSQHALEKTFFPLENITKNEVREIAQKNNIQVAQKPDSQEICFIPENNYRNFLKQRNVNFQEGFIRDSQGRILGKHQGKENYTVGQRKGIGVSTGKPLYVLQILENGDIIVGSADELDQRNFYCEYPVFQGLSSNDLGTTGIEVLAQVRYNSKPVKATIVKEDLSDAVNKMIIKVKLKEPAWPITPGQSVVFYEPKEKYILAGGKIK